MVLGWKRVISWTLAKPGEMATRWMDPGRTIPKGRVPDSFRSGPLVWLLVILPMTQ